MQMYRAYDCSPHICIREGSRAFFNGQKQIDDRQEARK